MDTRGNKKSDKSLVYARLYPQNVRPRNDQRPACLLACLFVRMPHQLCLHADCYSRLRRYPALFAQIFARNTHIMSRKPVW